MKALCMAAVSVLTFATITVEANMEQADNKNKNKQKDDTEDENSYISYNNTRSVISLMKEYPGDFGSDLFQELLTRKDISHLLLTDVGDLMH